MSEKQIHILRHSLGLKADGTGVSYRNGFITGPESDDFPICQELCEAGLMKDFGHYSGMHLFAVTQGGMALAKPNVLTPNPQRDGRK